MKAKKKQKNSDPKVVTVEDLTKHTYNLFLQASDHPGTMRSWTAEGSCRQDKAYHREVCVEKDETGCDQEQMKAKKKLRP